MATKKVKKQYKNIRPARIKMVIVFFMVALCLAGLTIKVLQIQQEDGERYEKIVLGQQGYGSETLPFQRGDILDSKGTVLATSEDVYNVILDCKMLNENEKYLQPTINALVQCFADVTEEEIKTILNENPNSQYYRLRRKRAYSEKQQFVELQEEVYTEGKQKGKSKNPYIQGVTFEKEYVRNYPYDTLACKVLGFTTSGNEGIGGLEDYYNDTLNGINGRKYGYLNTDNNVERTIIDAVNGNSIVTTLDLNIQNIVEQKIAEFNEEHWDEFIEGPGSKNTAVLIMNPNNGEILAMADATGYSLNDPWNDDTLWEYCMNYQGYTEEDIQQLQEETDDEEKQKEKDQKKLDMRNALWQNYCVTNTFEPGSTVKPFTVATGLETGVLFDSDTYYCDGGEKVGNHSISCVNVNGHGMETLEQTIMNSCNDALMQMAFKIGVEDFVKYQNIFNIGLRTNIDLPGEARTDTLIYTEENMGVASLATNSFGQNYNTTMIQVASAFASVFNGGYYYQPHLVKKIIDENGDTVRDVEKTLLKQTVSEQTSDLIRKYLVSTVAEGTAKGAKVPGYSMGGKTGTAEKQPRADKKFLVSFIGFAPAENPEILIYVIIDEPNLENQAQSTYATNLAKRIMKEIYPYLNIFPDEPVDEEDLEEELLEEITDEQSEEAVTDGEGQTDVENDEQSEEGQADTESNEQSDEGQVDTESNEQSDEGQADTESNEQSDEGQTDAENEQQSESDTETDNGSTEGETGADTNNVSEDGQ